MMPAKTRITHAMILAAGRGERMRPLTDHTPKSMLKVRGKPLIQWHLESLARADIRQVVINLAHLGEQIANQFEDGRALGLNIRYSREPEGALETAGGIALAKPWIDSNGMASSRPFLVVNADVFTDWPASHAHSMADQLLTQGAHAHLLLIDNPEHHPQGDFALETGNANSSATDTGPAWVLAKTAHLPSASNHRTAGLQDPTDATKPRPPTLTFSGIGVYDPGMFNTIVPGSRCALAPLLHQLIAQRLCMATHYRGQWADVGTPERLASLQ